MYKKPQLKFLNSQAVDIEKYKQLADDYDSRIYACLQAQSVNVAKSGYMISPVNMVFDYTLMQGTSFKTVENLTADLSLAVASDVKVFHRDDQSQVVSVSVPMRNRAYFGLREMLSCEEYKNSKSPLTIVVGIDEQGRNIVFDLAEAPHLLISGSTGSGKTVYLDDIILSIIYKASPTKVQLVLVDPGADMLAYEGLPHLMFKPASGKWEVYESIKHVKNRMNERFERLAKAGVRNIDSYNQQHRIHIPRIVVIIDKYLEYTHEMPIDFDDCVKEIARKGRAAGVHLIINAQSARSEVVSNDIKANIPSRIAFSVTDWHESKAILDKTGAQKLLGNGDMLFSPGLNTYPLHIQAPNVGLQEINNIVSDLKIRNKEVNYEFNFDDVREPIEDNVAFVVDILDSISQARAVDIYSIQKMFAVDYAEASDIVKFLEENKVISKFEGSKGRTVDHQISEALLERYRKELAQLSEENDE